MSNEGKITGWIEGTAPPTQPQTYSMEVNGLKYGPLVTLRDYEALREERDAARTRLLEVEAAHKQTIRHATALGEERDAAEAARKDTEAAITRLLATFPAVVAERDRAIRQRDHARVLVAHINAMIIDEGYSATTYLHGAPDGLSEADDDGWKVAG